VLGGQARVAHCGVERHRKAGRFRHR
jgi:hypothetical protein